MGKLSHLTQDSVTKIVLPESVMDEYAGSLDKLHQGMRVFAKAIDSLTRQIEAIDVPAPPDLKDLNPSFESLKTEIASIRKAIGNINIPEIPPFPEIPVPEKVDFAALEAKMETLVSRPASNTKKRQFKFKVSYDNFGNIDEIDAREI